VGQHVDNVGLKESAQHVAELGQSKQGPLTMPRILLVLKLLRLFSQCCMYCIQHSSVFVK
jgi:hypothetical protein